MNKYRRLLVFVSLILLVTVVVPNASAYFSTYTQTSGKKLISLGDDSKIEEEKVENGIKTIVISADENSSAIFVRVKAIHIDTITTDMSETKAGNYDPAKWFKSGDYYYYVDALDGKEGTSLVQSATLDLTVNIPSTINRDEVHVVVYEAIVATAAENSPSLWNVGANVIEGGNS